MSAGTIPAPPKGFSIDEDEASGVPAPPKGFTVDSEAPPQKLLPEVEQAIKTVPSPTRLLDVAAANPGALPNKVPTSTRNLGPLKPAEVAGTVFGAMAPVGMETGEPSASVQATHHLQEMATPGKRVAGATGLASDVANATAPIIGPAALDTGAAIEAAPTMATALTRATAMPAAMSAGYGASKGVEKVAPALGASPETTENVSNLAWLLPMLLHAGLRPEAGIQTGPEGTAVSGQVRGAGGGVAVTPEEVILRGGIAGRQGEIRIPRSGARPSAAPQIQPPTIEGGPIENPAGGPPVQPQPPAQAPPMHEVTTQDISEVGDIVAKLPVEMRAQATLEVHQRLAGLLLQQGRLVGPDHKIYTISNQKQAESLAQKFINEEVSRQDVKAKQEVASVPPPPEGFTVEEKPSKVTAGGEIPAQAFQKEDRVTLPNGDTGTVKNITSTLARVQVDGGGRVSINPSRLKASQTQSGAVPEPPKGFTVDQATPPENQAPAPKEVAKEGISEAPLAGTNGKTTAGPETVSGTQQVSSVAKTGAEATEKTVLPDKAQKSNVIFGRHGETALDQEGGNETVAGWSKEPLDERGEKSAAKMADTLKDSGVTKIVTSDLPRAAQTAQIVADKLGVPVESDERLRPQHIPETEGKKVSEIQHVREHYKENPEEVPKGGESHSQFAERQEAALSEIRKDADRGEKPLVVTHSTNLEHETGQKPEPGEVVSSQALKAELDRLSPDTVKTPSSDKTIYNGHTFEHRGGQFFKDGKLLDKSADIADAIDALEAPPGKVIEASAVGPTPESRAASQAAFAKNFPNDKMKDLSPSEESAWQASAFGERREKPRVDTDALSQAYTQARKELGKDAETKDVAKRAQEIAGVKEGGGDIGQQAREGVKDLTRAEVAAAAEKKEQATKSEWQQAYEKAVAAHPERESEFRRMNGEQLRAVTSKEEKPEYLNNGFGPRREAAPAKPSEDVEAIKARIAELEAKKRAPAWQQPKGGAQIAERLRSVADRMDAQIEDKRRPMTQNPTPKRMAEYRSRVIDADEMERTQKAMRALADAHEAGTVPKELSALRSKDEIARLVHKGLDSSKGGYYDRIPRQDYYDKSPAGKKLQEMIEGAKSPEATAAKLAKEKANKLSQLEADVQFSRIPGYFPTPKAIVSKMLDAADIRSGMSVLEPSAGKGNIADAIRDKHPDAKLSVVEQATRLQDILELKDHSLVDSDFLEHDNHYDRIVMNPPFEKGADVDHVRHAFDLLKPAGRLVAIMSPHAEFANDKKSAQFREWVESLGGDTEKLPEQSFKESGTGVNSRMVVIDKPAKEATPPREVIPTSAKEFAGGGRVSGQEGSETRLLTSDGEQPAKYRVVEAGSLVPSHNAQTFGKNPQYPEGVQERAYDTSKEAQNRVIQQAQKYDPNYTINTNPDAVNGPPIITPDGIVLGGNSRAMSTQRLYKAGSGNQYKGALLAQAGTFGLDKEAIQGMKEPVLVREVAAPKTIEEMRALGSALNKSMTGALGVSERAVSAGKAISRDTLSNIAGMLDGIGTDASLRDLLRERGKDVLAALVKDGAITERERPQFVDTATGGLSEEGKTFVERALLGSVVDDPRLMDATPKSVLNKLDGSLAALSNIAPRTDAYNILPLIRESLRQHGEIAQRGSNIEDYLAQSGLFGSDRDPAVDAITRTLGGKSLAVREKLRQFASHANFDVQGQGTLGLMEQPSPAKAFNDAFGSNLTDEELENSILKAVQSEPTISSNVGEAQALGQTPSSSGSVQRSEAGEPRPSGEGGTGTPEKAGEAELGDLFKGESGELRPGELGKAATEAAGAIGNYIRSVKDFTDKARTLQRGLETLDTQKQADILRAAEVMKVMKTAGMKKADDAAIYHHLENPEKESLSPDQDKWLDDVILPLADRNTQLYTELTDGGVPIENYVHRVVKGKGGMLDRIAQGIKSVGSKGSLSKSAPQTKSRTYMALEDREGNRQVVSIKGGQVTAWKDGEPENLGGISKTDEGSVFEDKSGNIWRLKQATTKEIENETNTVYYHSSLASTLASNIQLESAVRAMHFLENFKSSPEFKEIAFKGPGNPPTGWKPTSLPQFVGYSFEPRTAEVLDAYNDRLRQGNLGALDQVGAFMRVAMLLNPIMHPMNVAASWAMERGATGFLLPQNYKAAWRAGNKAVKAVIGKNQDFIDALQAGAPLQSHREAIKNINKLFFDQLAEGLDKEEPWAMKAAKALGIEKGNLLNALHKFSSDVAWASNDIFFLQAAYETQAKNPSMSLEDALKEVGRIIPEYRVPTRILDSQLISKVMTNRLATIFGAYHYSLLKSFGEVAKSALGAEEPKGGKTKAEDVGKAWDRIALLGLVTMALYPILDEAAKKITGDKHARVRRAGPFAIVDAVQQVAEHEESASTAAQRVVTPAPLTKSAGELLTNHELYSGHNIYDPTAPFSTQTQQIGRYLIEQMGQVGQYEKAETTQQKKRFAWQQVGVQFHKTRAEKVASDIAMAKVGTEAEDPDDHANRVMRREVLDQLRAGNRKPLEQAEREHELKPKQVHELERRAKLEPLEDTVHGFSIAEVKKVLDAAKADKNEHDIKLLEKVLHQKQMRVGYSWQNRSHQ